MIRAIGIDPGTFSFDVCGLEGDHVFLDRTIASAELVANPEILIDILQRAAPVDMIVGPSGYGLPWVKAEDITDEHMQLIVLSKAQDRGHDAIVGGMRGILKMLKDSGLPIFFAPSVIHLSTVPEHRKANRIDMGTADKLCAAALGIWDQSQHLNIDYRETAFIYLEMGGAFTAVMAVEKGKVVDGLGGTAGSTGYLASGAMDGELAYLMGSFHKEVLCSGGVAYIAGKPRLSPEELVALSRSDSRCRLAWEAFIESLVKCVAAEMSIVPSAREILISGRLARIEEIADMVSDRLSVFAPVRKVKGFAEMTKEAAQGAALIAAGLAGGLQNRLVAAMELTDTSGTVLDHLYVANAGTLKQKLFDE